MARGRRRLCRGAIVRHRLSAYRHRPRAPLCAGRTVAPQSALPPHPRSSPCIPSPRLHDWHTPHGAVGRHIDLAQDGPSAAVAERLCAHRPWTIGRQRRHRLGSDQRAGQSLRHIRLPPRLRRPTLRHLRLLPALLGGSLRHRMVQWARRPRGNLHRPAHLPPHAPHRCGAPLYDGSERPLPLHPV